MATKGMIPIQPFSLLGHVEFREQMLGEIRSQLSDQNVEVQDAYPCTPLQEGLFALSMKKKGTFMPQIICRLPHNTDVLAFKAAWQIVVKSNSTLRTRFVQTTSWGLIQVVLTSSMMKWHEGKNLQAYLKEDHQIQPEFGSNLLRFGIIDGDVSNSKTFIWTFHHALIDGWAMRLLLTQVDQFYKNSTLTPLVEFNQFIAHIDKSDSEDHQQFWCNYLASNNSREFPAPPSRGYLPCANCYQELHIIVTDILKAKATTSTIIQAAWAVLVARYTNASEATFGIVLAGRNFEIAGIDSVNGPTFTTVPMRVHVSGEKSISDMFETIHQIRKAMKVHQHIGLQNISRFGSDAAKSCNFQNLLVVQPQLEWSSDSLFRDRDNDSNHWARLNAYSLMMQCDLAADGFTARASYDSSVLSWNEMKGILEQFQYIIDMFSSKTVSALKDIEPLGDCVGGVMAVSDTKVERVQSCAHDVIWEKIQGRSLDLAITAWDGNLTYGQLYHISNRVAHQLLLLGVGPEIRVALVFEKSLWVVVSMMAVMKAGGVFVPIDPANPKARIQNLVQLIGANLLLCSERLFDSFVGITGETLAVCWSTLEKFTVGEPIHSSTVQPDNAVYIIFTSGSTGKPKGCVIEHSTCSTTMQQLGIFLGMDHTSRVLQHSSYTFDACILEILITLSVGGTICIPSDEEKMNNITAAINRMQVNLAFFTPSVARLISPDSVPTLKTLALGGEKMVQDDTDRWIGKVLRLLQVYGPTECCIICIGNEITSRGTKPSYIGSGFVGSYVVLDDDLQIVRQGVVGELYIGGPHLSRGYLNDSQQTAAAFVALPTSLKQQDIHCERWYKTGDLVKQEVGGSGFEIIGRRDAQVKLRGQRMELEEVDYQIRKNVDGVVNVVTVIATPSDESGSAFLAAFICVDDLSVGTVPCHGTASSVLGNVHFSSASITTICSTVHSNLPAYMIPKLFIPLPKIPLTTSGKVDRRLLQATAAELTKDQHIAYSGERTKHASPSTETEIKIQRLFAKVLNIDSNLIGIFDSFIRLGGESILAMKLVSLAREEGLCVTVRELFHCQNIFELAKTVTRLRDSTAYTSEVAAFAMVGGLLNASSIVQSLSDQNVFMDGIDDIYPCTPFQEGIMALSITYPGSYVAQHVFKLSDELSCSLPIFRTAWINVISSHAILRTRVVQIDSGVLMQLVSNEVAEFVVQGDLDKYLAMDRENRICLNCPLSRYAIIGPNSTGNYHFVWTTHHSMYDAWSLTLILEDFDMEYRKLKGKMSNGEQLFMKPDPRIPFNQFVKNLQGYDFQASKAFWLAELSSGEPAHFPMARIGHSPLPNKSITQDIHFVRNKTSEFRLSTFVRAAWAITISNYTHSNHVIFGATLSGRTGMPVDFASVMGPTITTVPVYVIVDPESSVVKKLREIEAQMLEMMPFEQTGLSIIRKMGPKLKQACEFQNLLVIQPGEHSKIDNSTLGPRVKSLDSSQAFDTYALTLECTVLINRLSAKAIFDPDIIEVSQMGRILSQFTYILQQICLEEAGKTIHEINRINPKDLREIWCWNSILPKRSESCVHHLIESVMMKDPHAPAICSWDGDLTRGELDGLSIRLAQKLIQQGVGSECQVPVLFDKSKWAIVAIIAIIKAGGAFVPLDPIHPCARHSWISEQINGSLILCSKEYESRCFTTFPSFRVIVVDDSRVRDLPIPTKPLVSDVGPRNALYVIFTSGTTGTPKGTVIEHSAYCSGASEHSKALCFSETSRFLQFASYSFDTSVEDILTTLMAGGCLCIPSEEERGSSLISAIERMNVNTADLTSSYISSISPHTVPSLKRVILGGEALTSKVVEVWADRVHLINAYGTTECCVTSLVNANISTSTDPANIGRAVGLVSWIVNSQDTNILVPIGATGELLLEGPAQARGYLNDEVRTNAAFINKPPWTSDVCQARSSGRFYKTGDLVRYNPDGTINYIGRKDTQVKLRGQRIELGEIEHHILSQPTVRKAVVLLPSSGPYKDSISALVEFETSGPVANHDDIYVIQDSELEASSLSWSKISDHLREMLPAYMMPSTWIAIKKIPLHTSAKADRSRLSSWLSRLPPDHRVGRSLKANTPQPISVSDDIAWSISNKIAKILIPTGTGSPLCISGHNVNLTRIGMDSIQIMSLAAFLKQTYDVTIPIKLLMNYHTTVTDVSRHIYESRASKRVLSVDKPFEVNLLSEFSLLDSQLESFDQNMGVIFLTGATGFLGTQILRQLLNKASVKKVIAHVRAPDPEQAKGRLVQAAISALWWSVTFSSKLEIWNGDLGLPMLGLSLKQWNKLQNVDAIIHNGAVVNWNADYYTLKPTNVNSTVELLKTFSGSRSRTSPCPKFVYVSGGRTFDNDDDTSVAVQLSGVDGYSQTKFISEMLVRSSMKRAIASGRTLQMYIVKPGLIIGTKEEGIANLRDFLWRYVAGALSIGFYPLPEPDDWLMVSSADRVASTVIGALAKDNNVKDYKKSIDIVDGVKMQHFWSIVNEHAGKGMLKPLSSRAWKSEIQRDINAKSEKHPLWPIQHLLSDEGNLGRVRKPNGVSADWLEETIRRNVEYLKISGFFA